MKALNHGRSEEASSFRVRFFIHAKRASVCLFGPLCHSVWKLTKIPNFLDFHEFHDFTIFNFLLQLCSLRSQSWQCWGFFKTLWPSPILFRTHFYDPPGLSRLRATKRINFKFQAENTNLKLWRMLPMKLRETNSPWPPRSHTHSVKCPYFLKIKIGLFWIVLLFKNLNL